MEKVLLYVPKEACKLILPKIVWDPFLSVDDSGINNLEKQPNSKILK